MVGLILLFIVLLYALSQPKVQNYLVDYYTEKISESVGVPVHLEHIDIDFYHLYFDQFYLEDRNGDTLFYVNKLGVELDQILLSAISNEVVIDEILLDGFVFQKMRDSLGQSNLDVLADIFGAKDTTKTKKPSSFQAEIKTINIKNARYTERFEDYGNNVDLIFPVGKIIIDELDFRNNIFNIELLQFDNGRVVTSNHPPIDTTVVRIDRSLYAEEDTVFKYIVNVGKVDLNDFTVKVDNYRKDSLPKEGFEDVMDMAHLDFDEVNMEIDSFQFKEGFYFKGDIKQFSGKEKCGFEMTNISTDITVTPRRADMLNLRIQTPTTDAGDSLVLKYWHYKAFLSYVDDVKMYGSFKPNSKVSLQDIIVFSPALKGNRFFEENKDAVITFDGSISGTVNRLKGKDVKVSLADKSFLTGNFRSRNLATRGEEYLFLTLDELNTSVLTLRKLLPTYNIPKEFDLLGRLKFNGKFVGFFEDFVANGYLETALGDIESNMRMNMKDGRRNSEYSGELKLIDFDFGKWTGNPDFGPSTFSTKVNKGNGLKFNDIYADLEGELEKFTFKNYEYKGLTVKGAFEDKSFEGIFEIEDPNIDFTFDGTIDFNDSLPRLDFDAEVRQLNLGKLNLTQKDYAIQSEVTIDMQGSNFNNISGDAYLYNIKLEEGGQLYEVDSVISKSQFLGNNQRSWSLASDIANATVNGNFELTQIPLVVQKYFDIYYKRYTTKLDLNLGDSIRFENKRFDFSFNILDTKNLTDLLDGDMETIKDLKFKGQFDGSEEALEFRLNAPLLAYKNISSDKLDVNFKSRGDKASFDIGCTNFMVDSIQLPSTYIQGDSQEDTLLFSVWSSSLNHQVNELNADAIFYINDAEHWVVENINCNFELLEKNWWFENDNYLEFDQNYIKTKNFRLTNGYNACEIESIKNSSRGIVGQFSNVPLDLVNQYIYYEPFQLGGFANFRIRVEELFKMEDINITAKMDSMLINEDNYGVLLAVANTPDLKSKFDWQLNINHEDNEKMFAKGFFRPSFIDPKGYLKDSLVFNVDAKRYPLDILEYFIGQDISNTTGKVDANLDFNIASGKPKIGGNAKIYDAAVTVNFLNTRYFIKNANLKVDNFLFDATGNSITDELGNSAQVRGGITHNHLKNFGLNTEINSSNFLLINTGKEDNESFYGKAVGEAYAAFSGPFNNMNIYLKGRSGPGTLMYLPMNSSRSAAEESFLKFVVKDSLINTENAFPDLTGMQLDIDLSVTPDAEIQLVFDEQVGDIMRGKGTGDLQIKLDKDGFMEMYGTYEIAEGSYLYTFKNLINKNFVAKRGGTISWAGDPLQAELNIEMYYKGLTASPYNLVAPFLTGQNLVAEARTATAIDLSLNLTGQLLQPNIDFDIRFPELNGQLKSYTETRLKLLRENQNELNRQVLGLIAFGNFLPSAEQGYLGDNALGNSVSNSLNELISSQLSVYVSNLINEVFTGLGYTSNIDFDVDYRNYHNSTDIGNAQIADEFEVKFNNIRLFSDRLSLDVGVGRATTLFDNDINGTFISENIAIEYRLTDDGRFLLRLYQTYDTTNIGPRTRGGLGLSYRKEFNSLKELFGGLEAVTREVGEKMK